MSHLTILTGSAASLPSDAVDRHGIVVVPLGLVLGGVVYADGELSAEEVMERSRTESMSTSSPSPGDFIKAIEHRGSDGRVLVLTVSSKMSSTFAAALTASEYFDPGMVRVLDTGTAAGAQGLGAVLALGAFAIGLAGANVLWAVLGTFIAGAVGMRGKKGQEGARRGARRVGRPAPLLVASLGPG
jgi:DegV family protein with EDD domain